MKCVIDSCEAYVKFISVGTRSWNRSPFFHLQPYTNSQLLGGRRVVRSGKVAFIPGLSKIVEVPGGQQWYA